MRLKHILQFIRDTHFDVSRRLYRSTLLSALKSDDKCSSLRDFCVDLERRGLVSQTHPPNLAPKWEQLRDLPNVLYAGFDPTSDSLHVGNLVIFLNLLRSVQFGCTPIALIGGATALVGDPSGRNSERESMAKEVVANNRLKIERQLEEIAVNFCSLYGIHNFKLTIVDNSAWYDEMRMIDFLRISKSFRVGEMLRMGAIKSRMLNSGGISHCEFSYQILQSYDWYQLSQQRDCHFQIGGNDQLGHIDVGHCYIRKMSGKFAAGVCLPIVTDRFGNKLGKSTLDASKDVWLSPQKTSPFAFYQFFRQKPDDEIHSLFRFLSVRPLAEVDETLKLHSSNLGKWIAQEALADELTYLVHGESGLHSAKECSKVLFHGDVDYLKQLSVTEIEDLFGAPSCIRIGKDELTTFGQLADRTRGDKISGSVLMSKGAFYLNGQRYTDPQMRIDLKCIYLFDKPITVVRWGKRKYKLVRWM
ncbi:hypothetical protein AB6A40_006209 [Gnathostoma spinigerum]|uniref:Tyrosine--tRNA ligase n=1 Tax=Gnathostoma spinigerum TaxID=75299 RepID=A0ABD6ETC2_9BILA